MKTGTSNHPKTAMLANLLGIEKWGAVGVLNCLWEFACDYAPQGDIGKWTDEQIALGMGWARNSREFVQILLTSGWVDAHDDPEVRLVIHDWKDHAPKYIKDRLAKQGVRILVAKAREIRADSHINPTQPNPTNTPPTPSAPTEEAAPPVCVSLDSMEQGLDQGTMDARHNVREAWRRARKIRGLSTHLDANGMRGCASLAQALMSGEVTLDQIEKALLAFLVEQSQNADLQGWGFKGFAANLSRWLPKSPKDPIQEKPVKTSEPDRPIPTRVDLQDALNRAEAQGDNPRANQIRKLLKLKESA